METNQSTTQGASRPNILILCMDQWDTHMQVPEEVQFPAMQRLESQGVKLRRRGVYPSRAMRAWRAFSRSLGSAMAVSATAIPPRRS